MLLLALLFALLGPWHGARAATVMDVINGEARLSTLSAALAASGLDSTLRGAGTYPSSFLLPLSKPPPTSLSHTQIESPLLTHRPVHRVRTRG